MANLNGQNIGSNYKGIINLDSTINTPLDTTLRLITDGMGNNSIVSISTAQTGIGTYTAASYASAKLIVGNYASANSEVANIGIMAVSQATLNSATAYGYAVYGHGYTNGSARSGGVVGEGKVTVTGDTGSAIGVRGYANDTHAGGFNIGLYGDATNGSSNYSLYMAAGDIYSAVTNQIWNFQTSLEFQSGGTRKLNLDSNGNITIPLTAKLAWNLLAGQYISVDGSGNMELFSNAGTAKIKLMSSLVQLSGTTSSYPAIKRNGAAIDFRLADDSGYAAITSTRLIVSGDAGSGTTADVQSLNNNLSLKAGYYFRLIATSDSNSIVLGSAFDGSLTYTFAERRFVVGSISINSSAVLQADSTTKGFLPPRMTTTQKNAISTPATGLVVFDTTLVKLAVYNGAAWETVTSV